MVIEWFIHDENQQTIDMGNFTWTAMDAFEQHNVTSTALSAIGTHASMKRPSRHRRLWWKNHSVVLTSSNDKRTTIEVIGTILTGSQDGAWQSVPSREN